MNKEVYQIDKSFIGMRIDLALCKASNTSRSIIQSLIKKGMVATANDQQKILSPSAKIKKTCTVQINKPADSIFYIKESEPNFQVIYEDPHIIVIDKPSGLVVHPGPGNKDNTLVNQLFSYTKNLSSIGGENRLGIVHRLDKETSGLMIVAKTNEAHIALAHDLQNHLIQRKYYAIVWGTVKNSLQTLQYNIGRSKTCFKKMSVYLNSQGGKKAITHYKLLSTHYHNIFSSIECKLETGRTHQIRVHMNHIKHPIVGDATYGENTQKIDKYTTGDVKHYLRDLSRHMLHSRFLEFTHPIYKKKLSFNSPPPQEINNFLSIVSR